MLLQNEWITSAIAGAAAVAGSAVGGLIALCKSTKDATLAARKFNRERQSDKIEELASKATSARTDFIEMHLAVENGGAMTPEEVKRLAKGSSPSFLHLLHLYAGDSLAKGQAYHDSLSRLNPVAVARLQIVRGDVGQELEGQFIGLSLLGKYFMDPIELDPEALLDLFNVRMSEMDSAYEEFMKALRLEMQNIAKA